jgi:hypothetical protein
MRFTTALLLAGLLVAGSAAAQTARAVNPEALLFESPLFTRAEERYRLELFMAGANPDRDTPVKIVDIGARTAADGRLSVPLADAVLDIPDGSYVAVVRQDGVTRGSRTDPSQAFVLSRPGTPTDRVEAARRDRFWTKVGISIGGALLALPFLLK